MPYRSLRPEERGNALATPLSAAARDFYSEKQSSVYTTAANASIQRDLTRHALELVQLELTHSRAEDVVFLLDLGAGSGLSTKAAQDWFTERDMKAFTLAFDISASMLTLASKEEDEGEQETQGCADFYCGNAAQKLPIRDEVLGAAIGVSMLQWLQPKGLEVCFSSLLTQLSGDRDSRAVFQVYPSGVAYVDVMETTALRVGFDRAETFVSFPHTTTAKKWFFCVEKLKSTKVGEHAKPDEERELCLFARRYERRCVLQWLGKENDCAKEIRERVAKEHVKTAWHIWRKYRRSIVDVESEATPAKKPKVMHAKAQQSLELYPSDKVIGRALQAHFAERAGKITLAFLLEHTTEVVDVLHTAYTDARKIELAAN
ncbi:E3 ubiquitin-protein ligase rnf19b [Phytophthora pseudosyringae]|uniref:E3 ubiquitin-protein ligase rnf19b n=1 Tax=Phytophthora pseudosyringae TaxID=221518 RepID=A0A8T1VWV2_9STRA|nr:E3 ubiquitin-protein ligase rnf19b [Phytophthora pseudosyringae]